MSGAGELSGLAWLAPGLAALMLMIAACCAVRLAIWRRPGSRRPVSRQPVSRQHSRRTEPDVDALHVLMGVAMAGMFEPRLSPVPAVAWLAVFGPAAAWFGWHAFRRDRRSPAAWWRCAHPAPHAVECAAMCYMLGPGAFAGHARAAAMPGMNAAAPAANPALAMVLAIFMLGYILWTTDQLTAATRARAAATLPAGPSGQARAEVMPAVVLAPKLAAFYKILMSAAMGYMLIAML